MIQKENLLKLLLNKPTDTPGENVPSYSDTIETRTNLDTKATAIFGSPYFATPNKTITWDTNVVSFNDECIILNNEITETQYWHLYDLIRDEEGFYGIVQHDSGVYLVYFEELVQNNISTNGIKAKIEYDITAVLKEASGSTDPTTLNNGSFKISKSSIDGRFLIATAIPDQTYFAVIEYTINVGTANEYRYQRIAKSTLTSYTPLLDDMYVSWVEENVQYAIGVISRATEPQEKVNLALLEITGTMDNISYSTLSNLNGVMSGASLLKLNYTPQIRYRSLTDRFYSYSTIKDTSHTESGITWYEGDVVLSRLNGETRTELSRTTTQYMYTPGITDHAYKNEADIVVLNNNVFIIETILTATNKIQATFKQLIGDTLHSKVVLSDVGYSVSNIAFTIISNQFNLYKYSYQLGDYLYEVNSVFRTGYNGEGYFDKNALSSQSGELYDITSNVAFARDLYNKSIVGDTINSVMHVPYNYLNENPIIREKLISETNLAIDDTTEEIEKNKYEELYVSFADAYKVWDMNGKKTYQQGASYEVAKQINEGFDMYVGLFRVTNNDNTTYESELLNIPIVNGEGIIEICFPIPEGKSKTLEILDQNGDIQFASIDISNLTPGAYKLTEKIKVEG